MPTTDDEYVYPRWTMGPPRISPELTAAFAQLAAEYRRAWFDVPRGQCAPAIGVHVGCEHSS